MFTEAIAWLTAYIIATGGSSLDPGPSAEGLHPARRRAIRSKAMAAFVFVFRVIVLLLISAEMIVSWKARYCIRIIHIFMLNNN